MAAALLLVTLLLTSARCLPPLEVPKCCPQGQQISEDHAGCEPLADEGSRLANASWLWPRLQVVDRPGGGQVSAEDLSWLERPLERPPCDWLRAVKLLPEDAGANFTLDLSDRRLLADSGDGPAYLQDGSYCFDWARCQEDFCHLAVLCPCGAGGASCWNRCCPPGTEYHALFNECQPPDYVAGLWEEPVVEGGDNSTRRWAVVGMPKCLEGEHPQFHELVGNFSLLPGHLLHSTACQIPLEFGRYCLDEGSFFYCEPNKPKPVQVEAASSPTPTDVRPYVAVLIAIQVLGAVFLLAIVFVYSCLPGLMGRLHARTLVAYCACLAVYYVVSAVLQYRAALSSAECYTIFFTVLYSFLATFFWLNVVCIDTALGITGLRSVRDSSAGSDRRRFLWYCAYALGLPALICALTATAEFGGLPDESPLRPRVTKRCWFPDGPAARPAKAAFYIGPTGFLMLADVALFCFTTGRIVLMRRGLKILTSPGSQTHGELAASAKKMKARMTMFVQYSKLFGVMGVVWAFQLVFWFAPLPTVWWYLLMYLLQLQPFFLFYVFCCTRKVLKKLKTFVPETSHRVRQTLRMRRPAAEGDQTGSASNNTNTNSTDTAVTTFQ